MSSEWEEVALEEVVGAVNTGLDAIKRAPIVERSTGIKCLRIQDVSQSKNFFDWGNTEVREQDFEKYRLSKNEIIMARTCSPGICLLVKSDLKAVFNNGLARIRANETRIDPRFLLYVFKSKDFSDYIYGISHGTSVQLNMKVGDLTKYRLPLPPLHIQQEISGILESLDDRITLLRETNATLEAIAQAIFKSWFVDFDPVRAKQEGRTPEGMDEATAALFPDSFEESELVRVPRGWRGSTLDGVSEVGIGKTPPRKESHWFSENSNDMRWVSIRDMGAAGTFLSETNEYLTADAIDRYNVRRVPDGTVLLSFKLTIGRVAITDGEMTTNEAIAHCKLTEQSLLPSEFIYLHLKQFDYTTFSSTSSIADAVNSKTVKAIPILIPDVNVVAAFNATVSVIFERIKTIQQQAKTLAALRDTLLPRLISGQLRLPEAEALLESASNP